MKQTLIIFSLFLFLLSFSRESKEESDFKISFFEIQVTVPDDFSKFNIVTSFFIERTKTKYDSLFLQLGKGFKGMYINVKRVETSRKKSVPFQYDSTIVKLFISPDIDLKNEMITLFYELSKDPTYPGDQYYKFSCEISDSLFHINASITRTDNWFPILLGTYQNRLPPFKLKFNFPRDFEFVASGMMVEEKIIGERKSSVWQNYPEITDRSLFFYAARDYRKVTREINGFKIIMYSPFTTPGSSYDYIAGLTYKSYSFFRDQFGDATANEFKIFAFLYDYASGLNFSCIPKSFFDNPGKVDNMGYPLRTFIHEISHTWWGNNVSFYAEQEYWLFEGFARYSELAALNPVIGMDLESFMYYRTKLASLPYLDFTKPISQSGYEEIRHLQVISSYYQGATLLYFIRYVIGKGNFNKTIRNYVSRFKNKRSDSNALIQEFQNNCSIDISKLIREYIDYKGYAEYSKKIIELKQENSFYNIKAEIINKGNKTIFAPLSVKTEMDTINKNIRIEKDSGIVISFRSVSKDAFNYIKIDPEGIFPIREFNKRGIGATAFPSDGDGSILFYNIVPGTPASRAGIQDGMELISVNGITVKNKTFEEITEMLMQPPNSSLKLQIRDSRNKIVTMILNY